MKTQPSRARRTLVAIALSTAFTAAFAAPPEKPAFPLIDLPEQAGGQRAIEMLGERLPAVARWYGKSAEEFAAILRRDASARLDRKGRLHYIDTETVEEASGESGAGTTPAATIPLDQTFQLHSRPGAKRTIYLDFDGHSISGTAWNASYGLSQIDAVPFDIDGVPYSFGQSELERIQVIWQFVAEDYAPFDVDVTTEEPPADVLARSGSGDDTFGTRVVITRDWVPGGCGCGGFAYVGIFDMTSEYYKPAFVFFDRLGSGNQKYVAEAISHEAGHNLGLNHDGSASSGYYRGHGSGETGWAPIMGVGYSKALVQWSKGEYYGATNFEDDFAVMQSNQLPLRSDDHGDTTAGATTLGGGADFSASGVIERASDVDVFQFSADAGTATASITLPSPSPNLDALLEVLDSSGTVLASANPESALEASLTTTLPAAGTYFLRASGVGKGAAQADGYSDYGSLGEYVISASVQPASNLAPQAVANATPESGEAPLQVTLSAAGSNDPDGSIVSWVWDPGDGSAPVNGQSVQHVYPQGSHVATLTVTDDQGLSDSATVTIDATPPVATPLLHVQDITVTLKGKRKATATAKVEVRDGDGNPISGALVSGSWSGVVSGSSSATTNSSGVASLRSPRTADRGEFRIEVTEVLLSGYAYSEDDNVETTDSASN